MNYSKEELLIAVKALELLSEKEGYINRAYKMVGNKLEKEHNAYCIGFDDCLTFLKDILSLNNEDA